MTGQDTTSLVQSIMRTVHPDRPAVFPVSALPWRSGVFPINCIVILGIQKLRWTYTKHLTIRRPSTEQFLFPSH